jgi:hypothetical protein
MLNTVSLYFFKTEKELVFYNYGLQNENVFKILYIHIFVSVLLV